mgnify:CR=1 FL=1
MPTESPAVRAPEFPSAWAYGGGICVEHATGPALIQGNLIENNTAGLGCHGSGGGISLDESSWAVITQNIFRSNTAATGGNGYGGGLTLHQSDDAEITHNLFDLNVGSTSAAHGGRGVARPRAAHTA